MDESTSTPDLFNRLADACAKRYRRAERLPRGEYAQRYPELAGRIRERCPAPVPIEPFGTGAAPAADSLAARLGRHGAHPRAAGCHRILRAIARGGLGIVQEAVQESLGRHVARTVLYHDRLADPDPLERLRREARAAAM